MKETAYLLQATLISLWWLGLLLDQTFYQAFQFPSIGRAAFHSFLLPDLVVIAVLSIVRAYRSVDELGYVILGGFAFATLYCINASILTGGGLLATTAMTLGLSYNLFLILGDRLFRTSQTSHVIINGLKTTLQVVCIWTITLLVFPVLIMKSFGGMTEPSATNLLLGGILFALFSGLGLYSGYSMVAHGAGTPLPLDQTQKLVTVGPYRYVRNPMAVAGIGQGISISITFSSLPILAYALLGAILWHWVVRPHEETDLLQRFGSEYEVYRNKVRCWVPRF